MNGLVPSSQMAHQAEPEEGGRLINIDGEDLAGNALQTMELSFNIQAAD